MEPVIDIATTTVLRPNILRKSLKSLFQNMAWSGELNFLLNIDPVGDERYTHDDVVNVVRESKIRHYLIHSPAKSSRMNALKWTWETAETDFVLQWEDDWELLRGINITPLVSYMRNNQDIAMIYFDRDRKSVVDNQRVQSKCERITPIFWERFKYNPIGGPPAIINRSYIKEIVPHLKDGVRISKLSREKEVRDIIRKWRFLIYTGKDNAGHIVRDIGREWKFKHNIRLVK